MSSLERKIKGLVESYSKCLEHRIEHGDSTLVCGDPELIVEVVSFLQDRDAESIHSLLGLNPLKVMEESLMSVQSALPTTHGPHCVAKGGLVGLAKAFEVLELAALNLYLGPWRKEYKLVKMYSGMFTHCVKPVLSMPQILELFGLLGYKAGPTRSDELRLSSAVSTQDFRNLSFVFFVARCECRLLLTALGKHAGVVEWELGLVQERMKGHTLQVALDNTKRRLEAAGPAEDDPLELSDVDLYTDDGLEEGGQERKVMHGVGDTPRSPSWLEHSSLITTFSAPAAITYSNGVSSPSSTSTSPREPVCVSTLNCQLTKTSPPGASSSTAKSSSASASYTQQSGSTYVDSTRSGYERVDSYSKVSGVQSSQKLPEISPEGYYICKCILPHNRFIQNCTDCNTSHSVTCDHLKACINKRHQVVFLDEETTVEKRDNSMGARLRSSQRGSLKEKGARSPLPNNITASSPSLLLGASEAAPGQMSSSPIPFHDCCDPAKPDPQFTCISCWVFHSGSCKGVDICQAQHEVFRLGVCSCGKRCTRDPLILCRYCGAEYCQVCWYRRPLACACGQTFDQSSSV